MIKSTYIEVRILIQVLRSQRSDSRVASTLIGKYSRVHAI